MSTTDDKKRELGKLLESIAVSGSSFEAANLSIKILKVTEELKKESGVVQPGPEESE